MDGVRATFCMLWSQEDVRAYYHPWLLLRSALHLAHLCARLNLWAGLTNRLCDFQSVVFYLLFGACSLYRIVYVCFKLKQMYPSVLHHVASLNLFPLSRVLSKDDTA